MRGNLEKNAQSRNHVTSKSKMVLRLALLGVQTSVRCVYLFIAYFGTEYICITMTFVKRSFDLL